MSEFGVLIKCSGILLNFSPYIRGTSGHCLGTFVGVNWSLLPQLNVVFLTTPLFFFYPFGFKGLWVVLLEMLELKTRTDKVSTQNCNWWHIWLATEFGDCIVLNLGVFTVNRGNTEHSIHIICHWHMKCVSWTVYFYLWHWFNFICPLSSSSYYVSIFSNKV
jgi:hypothetical protein